MAIELRNVVKKVGVDTHIYATSLKLQEGGFNVLLGTTLSGKTTLLRLMAGLEPPSSGEILFEGVDVTRIPVQKRNVSMVYQQFINYPNYSVFDNIASPLRVARVKRKEIAHRVEKIATMLKLESLLQRFPAELSGGQQQRIAIARALVKDSKLVLLDEPLANLDYKLREELRDEMPRLFADTGATVVYTTTEPQEALMLGGHTATLHEGRVTQYGPTTSSYRSPVNLLSASVFSDPPINTALVHKSNGRFYLNNQVSWPAPQSIEHLHDGPYMMAIRPHHVMLSGQTPGAVKVDATVKVAEISGSESVVHLEVDNNDWVSESHGIHPFATGAATEVFLNVSRCLYFDPENNRISV